MSTVVGSVQVGLVVLHGLPVNRYQPSGLGFEANDRFYLCREGLQTDSSQERVLHDSQLYDYPGNNGRRDVITLFIKMQ